MHIVGKSSNDGADLSSWAVDLQLKKKKKKYLKDEN